MSNKSILIVDTPACCVDCDFLDDRFDYPRCEASGKVKGYTFNPYTSKMESCPLIPMEHFIQKTKEVLDEADPRTGYCSVCCKYVNTRPQALNVYSEYFHDVDANGHPYDWRYRKTYRECVQCGHHILSDYGTERKENE